ncbi:serine hydrolase FSH [Aspergillus granulosus]|uniref:Serine hydrolase FSH n=1 Tax=Aspergillus granulosus TaxID=176169 RepID=A0ABR4HAA3_9EURO
MAQKPKPLIACFHGSGSNATIYEIQCSFLTSLLSDTFSLEFFDGPFPRAAGPGVLPAFEGYGPYKSWFDPETNAEDGGGFDEKGSDGISRVWGLMEERLKQRGGGAEWVGVMGFSQGSRVVGGLLLDQQRRERYKDGPGAAGGIKLKFGVCCMGGGAPMEGEVGFSEFFFEHLFISCMSIYPELTGRGAELENPDTVVRIPTLHLHGLKDEFLPLGRDQLAKYYDPETAKLYEINYHHAMPWVKAESKELARLIQELYNKTKTEAEKSA